MSTPSEVVRLDTAECWARLHTAGVGFLATAADRRADLFPINYLVDDDGLAFRTEPSTKLAALRSAPSAAFGVIGRDPATTWSVVIRGTVTELTDQAEIIRSGVLELVSWAPGDKHLFLRLTPTSVEGRAVARGSVPRASLHG